MAAVAEKNAEHPLGEAIVRGARGESLNRRMQKLQCDSRARR